MSAQDVFGVSLSADDQKGKQPTHKKDEEPKEVTNRPFELYLFFLCAIWSDRFF